MLKFKKIFHFFFLLLFFKAEAQQIFQKTYFDSSNSQTFNDALLLNDSTYILAGGHSDSTNNVLLTKIDKTGNILWNKQYRIGRSATAQQIFKINNNSFTLSGSASFDSLFTTDYFVMNVDSNGNVAWLKGYSCDYSITAHTIKCLTGGYLDVFTLYYNPLFSRKNLLIKFDDSGNIIWQKEFHKNERMDLISLAEAADGSVYIGGVIRDSISSWIGYSLLIKTDSSGNIYWSKSFLSDTSTYNYIISIAISDNGIPSLFGDYYFSNGVHKMFFINIDTSGNILSSNSIALSNFNAYNHKYISENKIGIFSSNTLLVMDTSYNVLFSKYYNVQAGTAGMSHFIVTNDNGFMLVGASGVTPYSAYIVKTDSTGNAGCQGNPPTLIDTLITYSNNYTNFLDTNFQFGTYTNYIVDTVILDTTIWCQPSSVIHDFNSGLKENIRVLPNPFIDEIQIAINTSSFYDFISCEIYDLTGREIFSTAIKNQTSFKINLSKINDGIYFLRLNNLKNNAMFKIVKN